MMGSAKRKCFFEHAQNAQSEIRRAHAQCSPLIHSIVSNDFVSGEQRPWTVCAEAQADLGLRCLHMPEDTCQHGILLFE